MFLDLAKKRRSIRKFTDKEVTDKEIKEIFESVLRAPTAVHRDVMKYILIKDKKSLEILSKFKKSGAEFLKGSSLAIAVISDKSLAKNTYHQDACIGATFIQLACVDLGLSSTWANVTDAKNEEGKASQEYLHELLNLDEKFNVECIIGIGHGAEEKSEKEAWDYDTHVEEIVIK